MRLHRQPKTLVFGARLENDYRSPSYHHQAPIAFSAHQLSVERICAQARVLARAFFASLASNQPSSASSSSSSLGTITNVSLGFQGIEASQMGQQGIQAFMGTTPGSEQKQKSPFKVKQKPKRTMEGNSKGVIDLTSQDDCIIILSSDSESEVEEP